MIEVKINYCIAHGLRKVGAKEVYIFEHIWNDGARSFEVHTPNGRDLTEDGCFDSMPTDEEIEALWTKKE